MDNERSMAHEANINIGKARGRTTRTARHTRARPPFWLSADDVITATATFEGVMWGKIARPRKTNMSAGGRGTTINIEAE